MGSGQIHWEDTLRAHRLKKRVRKLLEKMKPVELKEKLNCSKQYLNNQTRTYLPDQDFINRLEKIEDERYRQKPNR